MKKWLTLFGLLTVVLLGGFFSYFINRQSAPEKIIRPTQGVTAEEIVIGSVSALTGPTAFLGTEYLRGAQTYINAINDIGGIYGRKIKLITYDDQYDPPKTAYYTQKAILQDKVFALLNYVGTPTGKNALPLINEAGIPLVGLFTGAQIFRDPLQPYIFNIRASYRQEASAIVKNLIEQQNLTKVAIFYQYDDYGFDGLKGVELALAQYNIIPTVTASYERNTDNVEGALATIKAAQPEAIIMIGTYNPEAKFISLAKASSFNPVFTTVSFVGAEAFAKKLGKDGEGVMVSQVIPLPNKEPNPNCPNDYTALLRKYFPDASPTFGGLEGFINAKVLIEGLRRTGPILTRPSFITALESFTDYPITKDLMLNFSHTNHQGVDRVYLTQIRDGEYRRVETAMTAINTCIQAQ